MALKIPLGRPTPIVTAATVTRLDPWKQTLDGAASAREILVISSSQDFYLVTFLNATDGGALPGSGVVTFLQAVAAGSSYNLEGAQFIGVAGPGAGTAVIEMR
jgi:hypothetical protein